MTSAAIRMKGDQQLQQFIGGTKPAGKDDEAPRVASEHQLAGREMLEVQSMCQMRIGCLLIGQLDIEPHRNAIRLTRPSIHRFHDARPSARQHWQTGAAQPGA